MNSEYRALVEKVEAFTSAAYARRRADMTCSAGCSSCCEAWLTVSLVEAEQIRDGLLALSADARARVAARGLHERAREAALSTNQSVQDARCALLESDGRCAIYEHRPLVCRTQGHALSYPTGFVPEEAVRSRSARGDVTHCPLNFTQAQPKAEDVLDAERVDQILSVVGQRFAHTHGVDPSTRISITELALQATA